MLLRHDEGRAAAVAAGLPLGHEVPHELVVPPPERREGRRTVHLGSHWLRDERSKPEDKSLLKKYFTKPKIPILFPSFAFNLVPPKVY